MPLEDLLMERFKVRTRGVENPVTTTVGEAPKLVLHNNPNRLAWILVNLHADQTVYLSLTADVGAARGVWVDPKGGHVGMVWDEDFQMTAWAIWAKASGAGTTIYVLEVVEY